jgi:serine/threonine protein kinase
MNDFPNFAQYGYRIERELGHNRAGGRVTYLAKDIRTPKWVVLKQFQFAKSQNWAGYDSYKCEIQVLRELNHPGIPRYLDSFHTDDGFCMVQEYKQAESLAVVRSFDPDEVRQIAIAAVEVLVYLQTRIPPVIHRDIKPENLLVDDARSVYLVDFGFARVGEGEVGASSVVKGTLGFMPPEQIFNRQLTEASDLYSLGMTLICLLTGTKSDQIGRLVDVNYRVRFKHLLTKFNQQWVQWLEKMVEPKLNDRFPNAAVALAAMPKSPIRVPEVHLSQSTVVVKADRLGDVLTQIVSIANPIPNTVLEGAWEIAPHPSDPSPDLYRWFTVEPATFVGNQLDCEVTIATDRLMAGKVYSRKLLLHTNTSATTHALNLQVQTMQVPLTSRILSKNLLGLLGLGCLSLGWLVGWGMKLVGAGALASVEFGAILGGAIGLEGVAWVMRSLGWQTSATASTVAAVALGGAMFLQAWSGSIAAIGSAVILGAGIGVSSGALGGLATGTAIERMLMKGEPKRFAIALSVLCAVMGSSLGLTCGFGLVNGGMLVVFGVSSFALLVLLILQLRWARSMFSRGKSRRFLIKP